MLYPQIHKVFPQKTPVYPQKTPVYPQKGPVHLQKSPVFPPRRVVHFQVQAATSRNPQNREAQISRYLVVQIQIEILI